MKYFFFISLALASFLASCNSSTDGNRQIQDDMIAIHDEVMPMMSTFVRNSQQIDTILLNLDHYKSQNPELDTAQQRIELAKLQTRLENAHDSMNEWMHDLNLNFEGKSKDEITAYLKAEKARIEDINQEFKQVSEITTQKLNNYQP